MTTVSHSEQGYRVYRRDAHDEYSEWELISDVYWVNQEWAESCIKSRSRKHPEKYEYRICYEEVICKSTPVARYRIEADIKVIEWKKDGSA